MNPKHLLRTARRVLPAALLLTAMAGRAGPVEIELNQVVELKQVAPLPMPTYDLLPKPEQAPLSRLRCWQHGKSVVDEPIAEGPVASAAPLLSAPGAGGQRIMVLAGGTGLCLMTREPWRVPASSLMK